LIMIAGNDNNRMMMMMTTIVMMMIAVSVFMDTYQIATRKTGLHIT
jgi:hypothetical protein